MPNDVHKLTYRNGYLHPILPPILTREPDILSDEMKHKRLCYIWIPLHIRVAHIQRDQLYKKHASRLIQTTFRKFRARKRYIAVCAFKKKKICAYLSRYIFYFIWSEPFFACIIYIEHGCIYNNCTKSTDWISSPEGTFYLVCFRYRTVACHLSSSEDIQRIFSLFLRIVLKRINGNH